MLSATTFGDLARSFAMQNQTGHLKRQLEKLGYEVTTGRTHDLAASVAGDYLPLSNIESSLVQLDRYQASLSEAAAFVETGQRALENLQSRALRTSSNLLTLSASAEISVVDSISNDTRQSFSSVISDLNSQIGGQSLFAGMATDRAALADADTMLADIEGGLAGLATSDEIIAAVTGWFDDPGDGFETLGYLGSDSTLLPFDLGLGDKANFNFRANDQEIRDILKGFALGAILNSVAPVLDVAERQNLIRRSGELLITAEKNLAQYRADVGTTEASISDSKARNSAEISALELARANIVNVDQYEAAGELEAAQVQLEMLFSITARMSRLNLMEFLR